MVTEASTIGKLMRPHINKSESIYTNQNNGRGEMLSSPPKPVNLQKARSTESSTTSTPVSLCVK